MLLPAPVMASVGLMLAFQTNKTMGFVLVGAIVIFGVFAYLIGRKAIPLFRQTQIRMDGLTHGLHEVIAGIRVIRAFNRENMRRTASIINELWF